MTSPSTPRVGYKGTPKGGANGGTGGISVDSLVDYMRNYVPVSRKVGRLIVRTMLKSMIAALHAGDDVIIPGFGTFRRKRKKQQYRDFNGDLQTWEKTKIVFRPSLELRYLVYIHSIKRG